MKTGDIEELLLLDRDDEIGRRVKVNQNPDNHDGWFTTSIVLEPGENGWFRVMGVKNTEMEPILLSRWNPQYVEASIYCTEDKE